MQMYNLEYVSIQKLAQSMTDGIADDRWFLWVPDWLEDAAEKDYLVLLNHGDRINKEFEIVYQFKAEYVKEKCHFAISKDGKTVIAGYTAKKGVICYDCESGQILWNNPKLKKISRVRFNNFDEDIIEVLNDKMDFTYLDKQTGQALEPERVKQIRQVINWMRVSKNGKYLMTADTFATKDKANYTVYDTKTKEIKGRFVAQSHVGEKNFDVTNDGILAVCAAYERQGISLIEVETGNVLWTQKKLKRIFMVYMDKTDENIVVCCQYDGVYILNMKTGEVEEHMYSDKMHLNQYGEDIQFPKDKIALVGEHRIDCQTFSWLDPLGIKGGVVLQPAAHVGVMLYNYDGTMVWENKELFGKVVYQEDSELLCSHCSVEHVEKITIVSAKDGKTVATADIPDYACAFINDNKILVCNTGKMYDVSGGTIEKLNENFEFRVE